MYKFGDGVAHDCVLSSPAGSQPDLLWKPFLREAWPPASPTDRQAVEKHT